jgi:hypothetical protein
MLCKNSERKNINHDRLKNCDQRYETIRAGVAPQFISIKPFQEIVTLSADQKFICYVDS